MSEWGSTLTAGGERCKVCIIYAPHIAKRKLEAYTTGVKIWEIYYGVRKRSRGPCFMHPDGYKDWNYNGLVREQRAL